LGTAWADGDAGRPEVLGASALHYRHPGSGRGIAGVSLCLERGSFTVVAGERGAGKTTLLRVLLGLLPAQAGEIRWHGVPVSDPARTLVPPRVAYLPQALAGGEGAVRAQVAALLESDAELLAVDDLSAALTAGEERALWDALFARRLFWGRGACLAVSNRQAALSRADRIVVLHEGRVVGEGRLEALLEGCPELRRLWGRTAWAR